MYKIRPIRTWGCLTPMILTPKRGNDLIYSKKIHCWWPAFDQKHVFRADSEPDHDNGDPQLTREHVQRLCNSTLKITSEECISFLQLLKDISDYWFQTHFFKVRQLLWFRCPTLFRTNLNKFHLMKGPCPIN